MRILVVHAHPVAESYSTALFDCAVETLRAAGHEVRPLDLYACGFDPVMSRQNRLDYHTPIVNQRGLEDQVELLRWAEGVVFVYPTWWYSLPAMLKGWLERAWLPDVAFHVPDDGSRIQPLMTQIRLLGGISTYGAPWWLTRWVGDPGRRVIMRGLRAICAWRCRTFWLAHYKMDTSTPESRAAFLAKVRTRLASLPP
jgi:putative NADPH-quinone reductase